MITVAAYADAAMDFTRRTMGAAGDPGVVIVAADRDGHVACRAVGILPAGHPIECDTPVPIASLTKAFTAFAIEQLAANGNVDLNAPAWRYLPALRAHAPNVRVIDLLEQRAGYPTSAGIAKIALGPRSISSAANGATSLVPGAPGRFEYSNINYDLLGAIVERASGVPFMNYLQQRIFAPLHLTVHACDEAPHGYSRVFSIPVAMPIRDDLCSDVAAGGLVMTPRTYGRWLAAMLDGGRTWSSTVLDAAHWGAIFDAPSDSRYAKGWFVYRWHDSGAEYFHDGSAPQFHAFAAIFPRQNIAFGRFADAHEMPDGDRQVFSNEAMENIARGVPVPPTPLLPTDLYLRLALVAAIVGLLLRFRRSSSIRRLAIEIAVDIVAAGGLLWYVLPMWGGDVRNGLLFSADVTVLVLAILALLLGHGVLSLARAIRNVGL